MGRRIVAIVAGLLIGVLMIALLEWAGMQIYPVSANSNGHAAAITAQPPVQTGALLMVWLAWFFGSVDAAILSAWLAPAQPWRHVAVVTGILFLLALVKLASGSHPLWFSVATPLVFLLAALLGGTIGRMLFDRRQIGISR